MLNYIYHLCCPDTGEVRYIGKSNNPEHRLSRHLQAAKNPENYAQRWLARLLREGKRPILKIDREILPTENWQEIEVAAIADGFLRGWRLTNTSAGGEGVLLRDPADEARRIEAVRLAWQCPKVREAQSARLKVSQNTPEALEASRARMKKRWEDPEYARQNSEVVKAYYSAPEARKAQSQRSLDSNKVPEVRAARTAGIKAAWSDPDKKTSWVASLTAAQNTPEAKTRQSAQMKALHQNPEYKEKMKKVMSDPDMHKRRGLAISAAKQKKKAERLAALPIVSEEEKAATKKANYRKAWTPERKAAQAESNKMREGLTPEVLERRAETLRTTHANRKAERAIVLAGKAAALQAQQAAQLQHWLRKNCELGEGFLQLRHELFSDYANLTAEPMKQTQFYASLEQRGFVMKKSSSRFYLGLKLAATTLTPYTESS
jgi:hypothetical protein